MILEIDNIELSYGEKKILYSIYLKAETGKVTGILGRNGCGKTSLFRIIFGDLIPKYKNIRLNGVFQKKSLYKIGTIAFLPQYQLLPKNMKIAKAFYLYDVDWDRFTAVFEGFKKYKNIRTAGLSSGEQRVVETYLTLLSGKKIILLDEPFSSIAPVYVEKIKQLIHIEKQEKVILLTDHFYSDLMEISDDLYFLKNGHSKKISSMEDLKNEGYLNHVPKNRSQT